MLPGLPTVPELITGASEDLRAAGIDRYCDWTLRAVLEQYAIDVAVEFLQALEYAVIDVSAFERHHLRAQHGDRDPIAITVIAKRGDVGSVQQPGSVIVVDRIELTEGTDPTTAWRTPEGGRVRWWSTTGRTVPDAETTIVTPIVNY